MKHFIRYIPIMKCFLQITFTLIFVCRASLCLATNPRVALITGDGVRSEAITALVESELSGTHGIEILDRDHLKDILREHDLSIRGDLSATQAIQVSRVLACNIFGYIRQSLADNKDTDTTVEAIAFDADTGIRFCHLTASGNMPIEQQVSEILDGFVLAIDKWKRFSGGQSFRTVSLKSVRDLDLPASAGHVPVTLSRLLMHALQRSPDVAILERTRLAAVNQEAELTEDNRHRLMGSSVTLALDCYAGETPSEVRVRCILNSAQGGDIGVIERVLDVDSLGVSAYALADEVCKCFNGRMPEVTAGGLVREAYTFFRESEYLAARGQHTGAKIANAATVALAEAAYQKEPYSLNAQRLLWYVLWKRAENTQDLLERLSLIERCMVACKDWKAFHKSEADYKTLPDYIAVDTRSCTASLSKLIHPLLLAMKDGAFSSSAVMRIQKVQESYGELVKRLAPADKLYLCYLKTFETFVLDGDDLLDTLERYASSAPPALRTRRYTGASQMNWPRGWAVPPCVYRLNELNASQHRKLFALYQKWAKRGPAKSRIEILTASAMLVNDFPQSFDNPNALISQVLNNAGMITTANPSLATDFMFFVTKIHPTKKQEWHRAFTDELLVEVLRRLVGEMDKRKSVAPVYWAYLDEHDVAQKSNAGYYLESAWERLSNSEYRHPGEYRQIEQNKLAALFKQRYGGQIGTINVNDKKDEKSFEYHKVYAANKDCAIVGVELVADELHILQVTPASIPYRTESYAVTNRYGRALRFLYHARDHKYQLLTLDLTDGVTHSYANIETHSIAGHWLGVGRDKLCSSTIYDTNTAQDMLCVGKGKTYIPTDKGLICVDHISGGVSVLGVEQGLPTANITSCIELDGKLYLGCIGHQQGYFVRCDADGGNVDILACSGRTETHSVLDNCSSYYIEGIIHDRLRNRLFLTVIQGDNWLYAFDLDSGRITRVSKNKYCARQLRLTPWGDYIIRIHTPMQLVNSRPRYWGYGLLDTSEYSGNQLGRLEKRIVPLMGSIQPDTHKRVTKYAGIPSFAGVDRLEPESTRHMLLLAEKRWMLSSNGKRWQLLPRMDVSGSVQEMPLCDGKAPFALFQHHDCIIACTSKGVWVLKTDADILRIEE